MDDDANVLSIRFRSDGFDDFRSDDDARGNSITCRSDDHANVLSVPMMLLPVLMEAIRTEIVTTILMYSKEIGAVIQEANGTDLEIFFSSLLPRLSICLF